MNLGVSVCRAFQRHRDLQLIMRIAGVAPRCDRNQAAHPRRVVAPMIPGETATRCALLIPTPHTAFEPLTSSPAYAIRSVSPA